MIHLRVVDGPGSYTDYETEFIPRIGERVELMYGIGGEPVRLHHFRVKDVAYWIDSVSGSNVAIFVEEVSDETAWLW